MMKKEDLEGMHPTELAVLCQRVSEDRSMDESTEKKARALKHEWVSLQQPPKPTLKEQRELEQQQADLKNRMVAFLLGV